ncbi:superoxide dismutase, Ni [Candidatus Poribacteria bacterium]|jgi:nickel superoxide dismutase|nr:superoxide dismutase, Ni [Candidatus Poribacteria bacterium]MBT5534472.1 superoxide dismutase, Ni [Candidatus Poribacteria bacterium]MBT5711273.1 superoxide dismutase, Ni [Candidatus Poribacteria bacterium]MBT7098470.1 superoxide dismutase, Ni [Candidatus Poribacteria bacterium]MBT7808917.1 superoxide dismutase, Ni [Candidatus Poribacteria bacterium]
MIHSLLAKMDAKIGFDEAKAHCDVPCGIYDPSAAQISALTVVRMMDLMSDLLSGLSEWDGESANKIIRYVAQKEEHAEQVKHEIRIIWGDYIKAPQVEAHPNIHQLTHDIMTTASKCRQGTSRDDGLALVDLVNQFAEIFWATKGVDTKRAECPYAPNLETVYPAL